MVDILVFFVRAVLGVVLIAAGAAKVADRGGFARTLLALGAPAKPIWLVQGLSLGLPATELGLGLMLVTGLWSALLDGVVLGLMTMFSVVVVFALIQRPTVTCKCFGALTESAFTLAGLVRSLALTTLAVISMVSALARPQSTPASAGLVLLLTLACGIFAAATSQAAITIAGIRGRLQT
jgi:hypothetical protein